MCPLLIAPSQFGNYSLSRPQSKDRKSIHVVYFRVKSEDESVKMNEQ